MQTLFLDLASHDALIAAVDDTVQSSASVHARIGDHELLPMVEKILEEAGWEYGDLDQIACILGPGGFTSLRVAVAFANTLSDQLSIPSVGIHLSDLYRARTDQEAYWLHSTKKDQLFVRGGEWSEPTLITIEDLQATTNKLQPWMGELIDEHRTSDPVELKPIVEVLPGVLAGLKYQKEILTPWYGRGW